MHPGDRAAKEWSHEQDDSQATDLRRPMRPQTARERRPVLCMLHTPLLRLVSYNGFA